jgi:hypothetical protein
VVDVFDEEEPEVDALSLQDTASALESLLVARATGGTASGSQFASLRRRIVEEAPPGLIPSFVRTNRTIDQFWAFISKWRTYAERREQIWDAFGPLHEALDHGIDAENQASDDQLGVTPGGVRPVVTDAQRIVLQAILEIYLGSGKWPPHAFLEQTLEEHDIELNDELRALPEQMFWPDNRRMGGVVSIAETEPVALMVRGVSVCGNNRVEALFVAAIQWAVRARASLRHSIEAVTATTWRSADVMTAMEEAVGPPLAAYEVKLVLELMNREPWLPRWGGDPDDFRLWTINIDREIRRYREVKTLDDYLALTRPPQLPTPNSLVTAFGEPPSGARFSESSRVHPLFGVPRREHAFDCFVVIPFREPFMTIYREVIKPLADEAGVTCGHAGEIFGPNRIINDIYSAITFCKVVVAELTGRNPNVFYELGIAHEQEKPVVMLAQDINDVPFDVRDIRTVVYEWGEDPDAQALRASVRPNILEALRVADQNLTYGR